VSGLFGLGQSLLLALPPERAHDLAIKSLELGLYPRASRPDDSRLAQHLLGLDFPNPVGMAAGFDKNARVPRELLEMGFGFVEIGTLTPRAQSGNASPRIFRSIADRAIINRLGFNNEGQEAALQRLKPRAAGVVGVNLGAGRDSKDRIGDYVQGIARMAEVASYFTINISSPNTPGLRDLQAPEALDALLKRVQDARAALPRKPALLVKLAPDIADEDLPKLFPREYEHYEKHKRFEGEFFAPMPLGESRCHVADRVKGVFGTILRDASADRPNPVTDFVVVSHGVTIRCFRMQWMHYTWEWYEREKNPQNCSAQLIEGRGGGGYTDRLVFDGFEITRPSQQERREEGQVGEP